MQTVGDQRLSHTSGTWFSQRTAGSLRLPHNLSCAFSLRDLMTWCNVYFMCKYACALVELNHHPSILCLETQGGRELERLGRVCYTKRTFTPIRRPEHMWHSWCLGEVICITDDQRASVEARRVPERVALTGWVYVNKDTRLRVEIADGG